MLSLGRSGCKASRQVQLGLLTGFARHIFQNGTCIYRCIYCGALWTLPLICLAYKTRQTRQCVEIRAGETCSRSTSPNLRVPSSLWSGNSGAGGGQQSLDFNKPNKTSESAEGSDPLNPVEVMAQPNDTLRSGMYLLRKIRPGQEPWKQKWKKEMRTCAVA